MRLEIFDLAKADLLEGFHFYEDKEHGLIPMSFRF
jgi:hypothetical protein